LGSTDTASTFLICTTNAPVVHFIDTKSYFSSLDKLALRGDYNLANDDPLPTPTTTSQDGLRIENGGVVVGAIGVSHLGGQGINIPAGAAGSDDSFMGLVFADYCGGCGIRIERGNANTFLKVFAGLCKSDGVLVVDGSSGNNFHYVDAEHNEGYGVQIKYVTGSSVPRDNHFGFIWDENNNAGSLKIDNKARHNRIEFISYSSGAPDIVVNNPGANIWGGRNRSSDDAERVDGFNNVGVRHIETQDNGNAPTVSAGAADGTGASATVLQGRDSAGLLRVITGTSPSSGLLATVTFAHAYTNAPSVILSPANADTAAAMVTIYVPAIGDTDGPTTTTFKIKVSSALAAGTHYKFYFQVIGAN
jgi:hypothetical protein